MLYITGTPIGNLEDITIRQLNILKSVDLIAAEDTRHSIKLLNHYDITTKMTSYHSHSPQSKTDKLVTMLQEGKSIALITDSGMPIISDPGADIVSQCLELNIGVTTVPGPTALISALVLSGFDATSFVFHGFLGKKQKKDVSFLLKEDKTIILYEAPHKLVNTIKSLHASLGSERKVAIIREITKRYEEIQRFTLKEALDHYNETKQIQGEFVIVIEPKEIEQELNTTPIPLQIESYIQKGLTKKDAIKQVAKDMNLPKSEVYKETIS